MKSVVVLSGGMDSLAALAKVISEGDQVECLNFQYGSKHNLAENDAVKKIAAHYGLPLKQIVFNFNDFLKSDLLLSGGDIPEGHYADENMKKTVIPFRNGIMLAIAAGYAESIGADRVVIGNHFGDHAVYPDCRDHFINAMDQAIQLGTYAKIKLYSPFVQITKADIAKIGVELCAPFEKSWSCYKGSQKHCGVCGTCCERLQAFDEAGLVDPIEYFDRTSYKKFIEEFEAKAKDSKKTV